MPPFQPSPLKQPWLKQMPGGSSQLGASKISTKVSGFLFWNLSCIAHVLRHSCSVFIDGSCTPPEIDTASSPGIKRLGFLQNQLCSLHFDPILCAQDDMLRPFLKASRPKWFRAPQGRLTKDMAQVLQADWMVATDSDGP